MSSGQLTIKQLVQKAYEVRKDIITMLELAGSGHSAGPLDLAEIVTTLYFDVMNIKPEEPEWDGRDYFFLSKIVNYGYTWRCINDTLCCTFQAQVARPNRMQMHYDFRGADFDVIEMF